LAQDDEEDFFYQPRTRGGRGVDPAITRIALAAGGLTIIVIVTAFVWSGFHAGNFGPPPIISPPDVPLRVHPDSPGGLVVPGADVPIMSGDTTSTGPAQLAPQGQVPDVAQLDQAAGLNQPPPAPVAAPAAPAAPATPPGAVPATAASAPATATPAAPAAATPASAPAATAATPAPAATAAKPHPAVVQLAATPDEGSAEAVWAGLQKKAPDLLAGKNAIILPAVINGKSEWRVSLGGFASADAAHEFCAALIAKGAACTVPGP
jgi:hypothetical protein